MGPREDWIRRNQGFIIMYDITRRSSFDYANYIYKRIVRVKEEIPPTVFVGYQ